MVALQHAFERAGLSHKPAMQRYAAFALAVAGSLALFLGACYWMRGAAVPLLAIGSAWWWLLRAPGPISARELVVRRVIIILAIFFGIGPFISPTLRLLVIGGGVLVWFVLQPVKKGVSA